MTVPNSRNGPMTRPPSWEVVTSLIAGGLYGAVGIDVALYYVAGLFGGAAAVFALLPLTTMGDSRTED